MLHLQDDRGRSCRASPQEEYRVPDHDTVGKHAWPALLSRARSPCKVPGNSRPRVSTTPWNLPQWPRLERERGGFWPHLRRRRATSRRRRARCPSGGSDEVQASPYPRISQLLASVPVPPPYIGTGTEGLHVRSRLPCGRRRQKVNRSPPSWRAPSG